MNHIVELGHVGLHVNDLSSMRDFYTRVLGLEVTDENAERGRVFLSSRPEFEHHELLLAVGRKTPEGTQLVQQLSWRVGTVAGLQELHSELLAENTEITAVITHGNALAVYFLDPERNLCEVYVHTGLAVPQPFRRGISLAGDPEAILAENERIVTASRPQHG
jgi:catechol-2,3-dioxygenase